jgi:hypothetical protein
VVELCLFGFHKLPFTCSYLPGQSKVHVLFWTCLLVFLPPAGARVEQRMLISTSGYACMIALLVVVAVWARRRTSASFEAVQELIFEDEYQPDLLSLGLDAPNTVHRG